MRSSVSHWITKLEWAYQYPPEARLFFERAAAYAGRTCCNFETAAAFVASRASDQELDVLAEQLERIAFGDDMAARDAAKRETFAKLKVRQNSNLDFSNEDRK